MVAQTLTISIARNGLNKDLEPTDLGGTYTPSMKNMIVEKSKVRKRLGDSEIGYNLPLSGVGSELIQYVDAVGGIHLIALTTTNAYELNASSEMWELITPSIVLEACGAGWTQGSGDTITHDTTHKVKGTKSLKIVLGAARSDGDLLAYKDISSADITAHNNIGFWIRSSTDLAAEALEIVVSESNHGSGEKTGTYVECLSTALTADTWKFVQLAKTLTDYNAVISVSIFANATLADELVIYLDDVRSYTPFTGAVDDRWSHTLATDTSVFTNNGYTALCISNGVDSIFYYEGQSGDVFQSLDMSDFTNFAHAKEIEEFWNHFFVLNFNDNLQNIRDLAFADLGNITDWTGGTSDARKLTDTRGEILRVKKLGSDLIIYSEKTISTCRYLGAPLLFAIPTLVYEAGLFSPKAIWDSVNVHFFLSSDYKVYGYPGGRQLLRIGEAVESSLFAELDISKKAKVVVGVDQDRHKLYFFIPLSGDSYAKTYYAADYKLNPLPWEYGRFYHDVRDFSVFENYRDWYCDDDDITDLYCDEIDLLCDDSYTQSGYAMAVVISSDGYVYKLDEAQGSDAGENIEAYYDTEDITLDKGYHPGRWKWMAFSAKSSIDPEGVTVTANVYYSIDGGESWVALDDSPITLTQAWSMFVLPLDILGRTIRFRVYQNSKYDLQIRDNIFTKVSPEPIRG